MKKMNSRRVPLVSLALLAVVAGAGVGAGTARRADAAQARRAEIAAERGRAEEAARRDADFGFYQARVAADPWGAGDRARLAGLYLRRARETGDYADFLHAEAAARASLAARAVHNAPARVALAGALMAQHRFAEARAVADSLVAEDPQRPSYRGLLAELQLELGDYAAARATFGSLEPEDGNLGVAPRLARWYELNGRTNDARTLLHTAARAAEGRGDLPREQVAWFHLRAGDLELRNGQLKQAEKAFRAGLAANPGDYRLLGEMARLEVARGRWKAAREFDDRAVARVLDPATLAVLSDGALAAGDSAASEEYARAMEVSVRGQAGALHRGWALFLLDRGRSVDAVAAQAAADVRTRRDVYGWDLLAWALHHQGKDAEARRAMAQALRLGTRDAQLLYHAGMIEHALGNDARAAGLLRGALDVDPRFHPLHAREAGAVLRAIRR
jgi:tetratricopeptide (TPR) repeat protein